MFTTEALKADILETAKFAAQTHWRLELEWQRQADMRPYYSPDMLSPAGKRALDAQRSGDAHGLQMAMTEFTHWDGVIFSTLALALSSGGAL